MGSGTVQNKICCTFVDTRRKKVLCFSENNFKICLYPCCSFLVKILNFWLPSYDIEPLKKPSACLRASWSPLQVLMSVGVWWLFW